MKNLYDLFVSICRQVGDSVALIYHEKTIDYNTLYMNVEKIYELLISQGVKSGDVVGLSVKRSPNAIAAMLAVLKSGATYMPFNPLQTSAEWCRMMEESGSKVVVSDGAITEKFFEGLWIELDKFEYEVDVPTVYQYTEEEHMKRLVYIIYTSGSTGKSKGVGIRQESLYNLILHGTKEIGLVQGQRIIALSNLAFDMSVPETIMPVLLGMSIVLLDDTEVQNPRLIRKQMQEHNVSTLLITPTRMSILLSCKRGTDFLKSIKYILFGAEKISLTLLDSLREATDARIFNLYGPTETTAYLTYSDITNKNIIDIGNTIANMNIMLVDEEQKVFNGPGEGEILITGIGVSEGYITPDSKQSFQRCPELSHDLIYFTGDIAKRLESGEIVYLGRRDNQVKYRGYRLGLEEIENKIQSYVKEIRDCVVLVRKDGTEEYLTLMYVSPNELDISDFKHNMYQRIPKYEVPTNLIRVESLPLNKNGKVDRAAVTVMVNEYFMSRYERKIP